MTEPLIFLPVDRCGSRSVCGHYEVKQDGPTFARSWSAWFKSNHTIDHPELIDVFRDGSEDDMRRAAKAACQRHAERVAEANASKEITT